MLHPVRMIPRSNKADMLSQVECGVHLRDDFLSLLVRSFDMLGESLQVRVEWNTFAQLPFLNHIITAIDGRE